MPASPPSPPSRFAAWLARLELPAAALVALCSGATALGWLLGSDTLLHGLPGAPMVLPVALALLMVSTLLLLRGRLAPAHQLLALRLSGLLTLTLGVATSLEWLTHRDLGVDFAPLHMSLIAAAAHPGRPAPEVGLSLVLLGLGLGAQSFGHHARARMTALYFFIGMGVIGALTLAAQAVGLRLSPLAAGAGSLPSLSATCQLLLALALVAAWNNVRRRQVARISQAAQLGVWAMSVLILCTASIALGALAIMQRQIESGQDHAVRTLLELRQRAMRDELAHGIAHAAAMGALLRSLAQARGPAAWGDRAWIEAFERHPELWHDNSSVRMVDAHAKLLASFGQPTSPNGPVFPLRGVAGAALLRGHVGFVLQTRIDLDARGRQLLLQQDLPRMTQMLQAPALWPGQQSMLCRVDLPAPRCLAGDPRSGPPSAGFLEQMRRRDDTVNPGTIDGLTWKGRPGMLASAPIGPWGLRMVLVVPSEQVVRPVRAALGQLSALFVLVVALGTWALRGLISPLSRRLDQALRDAQEHFEHFHAAADTAQEALAVFEAVRDHAGRVTDFRVSYVNAAAAKNFGTVPAEAVGRRLTGFAADASDASELFERFHEVLRSGRPQQLESACVTSGAGQKWLRRYIMKSGDGLFVIAHDITEARQQAHALSQLALHDPLTDLPNRRSFELALQQSCERAASIGSAVAVVFCDADDLKRLNDQRGHACGDAALRELAGLLRGAVRHDDLVARLAGDEFVVLLQLSTDEDAGDVVRSLRAAVDREVIVCGQPYMLRASIGWAVARGAQARPQLLLQAADDAMYQEKQRRRHHRETTAA